MVSEDNRESIGHVASTLSSEAGLTFIEQLQISSSKPCTKQNTKFLVGVNENEQKTVLTKAACKCWDCETCAARNARTWIACIINGVNSLGGQWSFLTVTAHRKMRGKLSFKSIREGWKKLYNRIREKAINQEKTIAYCKVWEQHKDGSVHLHILINVCFGTKWAKDNAAECGLGFMADWHEVDNAGMVAGYIAKYTLKNAFMARGGVSWPKGLRRIEKTRNWPNLPQKIAVLGWGWVIKETRGAQLASGDRWAAQGFEVIDTIKE